jgi:hypothetical protein
LRALALPIMLLTLGFVGVGDGIVLCFGGDGHVAIESVGLAGCEEADETAGDPTLAIAIDAASSHCGPCVDVAFASSSTVVTDKTTKPTPSPPATISTTPLRPPALHQRATIAYRHTTHFNSEKPHTVVIRC